MSKSMCDSVKKCMRYSKVEDVKILDFIIRNKRFQDIRGNELWKIIEARNLLENRSWQSMKERFRKSILPKINQYDVDPNVAAKFTNRQFGKKKKQGRFMGKLLAINDNYFKKIFGCSVHSHANESQRNSPPRPKPKVKKNQEI